MILFGLVKAFDNSRRGSCSVAPEMVEFDAVITLTSSNVVGPLFVENGFNSFMRILE